MLPVLKRSQFKINLKRKNNMSMLDQIVLINAECFTSDDPYSHLDYLKTLKRNHNIGFITVKVCNKIVGYIIYKIYENHIESLRRALTKNSRGQGLGLKLSKRLIRIAKIHKKDIYTYVSKTNLPSLNSNFKVGYRVTDISDDWVYIRYVVK